MEIWRPRIVQTQIKPSNKRREALPNIINVKQVWQCFIGQIKQTIEMGFANIE